jgi:lipopolysaccharide transport system ATP-binding protein
MSDVIISVEGLGKKYRISHQGEKQRYTALRDVIAQKLKVPFQFLKRNQRSEIRDQTSDLRPPTSQKSSEDFWALKDVSFEVKRGEVVGIIGRNGAGKSTLLKILSRITEPTEGRVHLRGRVASLLEVGTGFHPELTGRENVFLNGAILGMSRAEIRKKFDEIVAFAEVEKFLDTPVKRYSSGMYVRLAFAVAAHLEPEILIVDEVLAVGDFQFQQKCLGKMGEVASGGRTVFFVSHNMAAVTKLCRTAMLFDSGRLADSGTVGDVVGKYICRNLPSESPSVELGDRSSRTGRGNARLLKASLRNCNGDLESTFSVGDTVVVRIEVEYLNPSSDYSHCVEVANSDGTPIYHIWDADFRSDALPPATFRTVTVKIGNFDMVPDRYQISLWVGDSHGSATDDYASRCLSVSIQQPRFGTKRIPPKSKALIPKLGEWSYSNSVT